MNYLKLFCVLLCSGFYISFAYSQDTLVLLNGKRKSDIKFMEVQNGFLRYQKNQNQKIKLIPQDQIYALFSEDGRKVVSFLENDQGQIYSEQMMFDYIDGMYDAHNNYNNILIPVTGFVTSVGAGIWPGVPLGLLVPVLYPGVVAMNDPKTENLTEISDDKKNDEYYLEGYKDVARQKKVRSSVIASGTGFVIGMFLNLYVIFPR